MSKRRIYKCKGLDSNLRRKLENEGYELIWGRNLEGKMEYYYFRPYFHESARHAILVYEVAEYLRQFTKKVKEYLTVRPDIIFEVAQKKYAIEIETGVTLKKNKRQLMAKVKSLREDFGRSWFFVVTNRNLVRTYKRYGKTLSKRNLRSKINKILAKEGIAQPTRPGRTYNMPEAYY